MAGPGLISKATVAVNYFAAGATRGEDRSSARLSVSAVPRSSAYIATCSPQRAESTCRFNRFDAMRRLSAGATGRDPDQDPDAERYRNRREGMSFGLLTEPVQRLPARFGTRPHRVVGKVGGLSDCTELHGPEPVFEVLQDRPERIGNLLDGGGSGTGGALAGAVSDDAEFLADAAQMIGDRGNAGLKLR
jgi:hypothetical protein